MSEENVSLGKVVQTIMESLSEAITQLILFVMGLQESNSPMPAHIPPAAEGVTSASITLADVATGVANEEYSDYPEIQNPILEASQDVRISGENLLQAVANLKTNPDRGAGWANLLDACRTISGQTCYILQLVYGAELTRLLLAAQAAIDLAGKTSSPLAAKDPQKFADQVSELAGQAEALANFLREKAAEEESPLAKEEMLRSADLIANLGNEVLELANRMLKNPKDAKLPPLFDAKVKELQREIEKATQPVKDKLALLPEKPPRIAPTPVRAGPSHSGKSGDPPPVRHPSAPKRPDHPSPSKLADKAKDDLRKLFEAASANDSPAVGREAQNLADDITPLIETLEGLARDSLDPERKAQLQDAANELKGLLPRALTPAGQALRDPSKKKAAELPKVKKQLEKILDYVAEVAKPAPDVETAAAARILKDEIPKLAAAAAAGNKPLVQQIAKHIEEVGPAISRHTRDLTDRPIHPKQKTSALEDVKKLDQIIPEIIAAAQAVAPKPNDKPNLEKLDKARTTAEEALQDLANSLNPDVLANVRKQQDDLNALDAASVAEQPQRVAAVEKVIAARDPVIEREVLEIAASVGPDAPQLQKSLANEANQLNALLPPQVAAAQDVVKQPTKEEPKAKLGKNVQEMKKVLDNVAADVQKAPPGKPRNKNNPQKLLEKLQDLMDAMNSSSSPADDKVIQNKLNSMAPELERLLADVPDDEQTILEDKLENANQALGDKIAELQAAALAGKDAPTIDKIAQEVMKQGDQVTEAAKELEKYMEPEDELKPLLDDALDDLTGLLGDLCSAARECGKNPREPRNKKNLGDAGNAADKTRKFVKGVAKPPPEKKENDAKRRFPKGVKRVIDAADEGGPSWLDALKNLKKTLRDMNDPVKDPGPDYLGGRDIPGAIKALEDRLNNKSPNKEHPDPPKRVYQDAKEYFQKLLDDPKSMPKIDPKTEALANIKDAQNLLDRLESQAHNPKDPKRMANTTKALANKLDPIIKAAKNEAAKTKDPKQKKQLEDAVKELEKLLPPLVDTVKDAAKGDPSAKEKLEEIIAQLRAPLAEIEQVLRPDPIAEATALGRKEEGAAMSLASAANKGDVKNAEEALRATKDLQQRFAEAAKRAASKAPQDLKQHIDKNLGNLDKQVKELDPLVQALAKNKDDPKARDNVAAAAKALRNPISNIIADLEAIPEAQKEEVQDLAREILAALRNKNIKKLDPSNLLKISRHLAGLLSDMAQKTGDELRGTEGLNDRARAALELEELLAALEKSGRGAAGDPYANTNIDELLGSLTNLVFGGGSGGSGPETQLTKQISSVAREIKQKATGSLEGTQLHSITQSLAADLQKFAEADSSNKRSDLIILGKAISVNIIRLADELKRLASQCTDPKLQAKLLMQSNVLRNYATQLKIMASVRAASPRNSNDSATEQLVSLTKNLSAVLSDATNVVSIMKQTKRGQL